MTPSTYLERRWPDSPVFQDIARHWCEDQSRLLLELVWRGYDRLLTQDLSVTAFSDTDEAKEESLNFLLCLQINHCMTGDEPCCAIHQPPEQTKRKRGRGRSPQPDIGFTLYDYPRRFGRWKEKFCATITTLSLTSPKSSAISSPAAMPRFLAKARCLGICCRGNPSDYSPPSKLRCAGPHSAPEFPQSLPTDDHPQTRRGSTSPRPRRVCLPSPALSNSDSYALIRGASVAARQRASPVDIDSHQPVAERIATTGKDSVSRTIAHPAGMPVGFWHPL